MRKRLRHRKYLSNRHLWTGDKVADGGWFLAFAAVRSMHA